MTPVNGNTSIRQRSSDGCTLHDCGCAHTDREWIQMCDAHYAEYQTRHVVALEAHKQEAQL